MKKLKGLPISPGYASGFAFILKSEQPVNKKILKTSAEDQLALLEKAISMSKTQIDEVMQNASLSKTELDILNFQKEALEDESFIDGIKQKIVKGFSVEEAIKSSFEEAIEQLKKAKSEYLRERVEDLRDIMNRLLDNIFGKRESLSLNEKGIIIKDLLTPSDFAVLDKEKVLGIVTREGGSTSHVAIMAKERGIPMVSGVDIKKINSGDFLVVDGYTGAVVVNPSQQIIDEYKSKAEIERVLSVEAKKFLGVKAMTVDGYYIKVEANVGNEEDLKASAGVKAEGIGLLRTEFLYFGKQHVPTSDELSVFLKRASETFPGEEVIVRTLDVGGDKLPPFMKFEKETNPFLGLRGIRLTLRFKKILKEQLNSILTSNVNGNLKIMLPMVSDYDEVVKARRLLKQIAKETNQSKVPELGIMVETPAAAIMVDVLSEVSDFFSIGTNDLTQYVLAADRENKNVAYLYDDMHPAVLRNINEVIKASKKPVGICGELASKPLAIPLLVGMGITRLSVNPPSVLPVKMLISKIKKEEAEDLASRALHMKSAEQTKKLVADYYKKKGIKF